MLTICYSQAGIIQRIQKQQVLANLQTTANSLSSPISGQLATQQAFISSPSGTFSAILIRKRTNPGSGGLGTDYCHIAVVNTAAQQSVWESPCKPITTLNPCTLLLSDEGLQILDGNRDAWNTDTDDYQALVLLENGDLQLVDQSNQDVWQASDDPLVNQICGSVAAPGSAPFNPPFSSPLSSNLGPFTTSLPLGSTAAPVTLSSQVVYFLGMCLIMYFITVIFV
eukprot:Gb_33278 [translate_table: standard]